MAWHEQLPAALARSSHACCLTRGQAELGNIEAVRAENSLRAAYLPPQGSAALDNRRKAACHDMIHHSWQK